MSIIEAIVREQVENIKSQLPSRAARVALELKKSVFNVMSHPGVSAPGEPPGIRTGNYRNSFVPESQVEGGLYISKVSSDVMSDHFSKKVLGKCRHVLMLYELLMMLRRGQ